MRASRFAPEVRERAVRMVLTHQGEHESQWAAIRSIAAKIDSSPEALRRWVRQAERDQGVRPGLSTEERERLRALERENWELRRANEILRKASAFFAQAELGRRFLAAPSRRSLGLDGPALDLVGANAGDVAAVSVDDNSAAFGLVAQLDAGQSHRLLRRTRRRLQDDDGGHGPRRVLPTRAPGIDEIVRPRPSRGQHFFSVRRPSREVGRRSRVGT